MHMLMFWFNGTRRECFVPVSLRWFGCPVPSRLTLGRASGVGAPAEVSWHALTTALAREEMLHTCQP